jgi:hypothetical protein
MLIAKARSTRCRCSNRYCQSRITLPRHPATYRKIPLCHQCRKGHFRPDTFRDSGREHAGKTCRCGQYSFPHRRGGGYCSHNQKVTEAMMQERYESRSFA